MGQRGRRSGAELSVVQPESAITSKRRPEPPDELTKEQSAEWIEVVNNLPADWFPTETRALLVQYCRHVVAARFVASLIDRCVAQEPVVVEDYGELLKMQEREGRAISALATRMRMTQQSTYSAKKSKKVFRKKPWEP